MIRLFVNIDHIATLREARKTYEPDPLEAALIAQKAGAYGITAHLREDRRHVQDDDISRIKNYIKIPLNLEMAGVDEMIQIACKIKPFQVTVVPEKRQELTTEGGLNILEQEEHLVLLGKKMSLHKILYSLFIDPEIDQVKAARRVGANSVELNTGPYSENINKKELQIHLAKLENSAKLAYKIGLSVFAGHGLTNKNVQAVANIPEIEELNIGHHIVSRSVIIGMEQAVKEMLSFIGN